MTRPRRPTPAPSAGGEDWLPDAPPDHLEAGNGDEAVAVLVEDAFEPAGPGPRPVRGDVQQRAAAILDLLAVRTRLLAAWCLVAGQAGWIRTRSWQQRATLWSRDALTVAAAWVLATSVALGLWTRTTWRAYRARSHERRAARLAVQSAAREAAGKAHELGAGSAPSVGRAPAADPRDLPLREAALNAWGSERDQRAAQDAEAQRRRAAREANVLRRLAATRLGLAITPASGVVDVDGLLLGVARGAQPNDYALVLFSTCPTCGAPVVSGDVRGLADLGAAVDEMNARHNLCEECRIGIAHGDATVEKRLVAALRDVLGSDGAYTLPPASGGSGRVTGSTPAAYGNTPRGNGHAGLDGHHDAEPGRANGRRPR